MNRRNVASFIVLMAFFVCLSVPLMANGSGQVELNTATVAELQALPCIGPKTAERIVEYRKTHGSFQSVDELVNVKGIGAKKLERLRPLVHVSSGD